MTSSPDPLTALQTELAALATTTTAHRGQITLLGRRLSNLETQVADLTQAVTDTLDAASPKGPPAPRWDHLDPAERTRQLDALRRWVHQILIPCHITSGAYTLPPCWDQHLHAIIELSVLAAQWRKIHEQSRPGPLKDAWEWLDRWLPGAMTRITPIARRCAPLHQPDTGRTS